MTTGVRKAGFPVVVEAREKAKARFEKSRTRKKYGWTFEEWEERFVCGDKFTAVAAELTPVVTRHFVKDIFHRYFAYLEEEHKIGRELRLEEYKAGEYARRESELPEGSMVRNILKMARAVGYRAEIIVNDGRGTMLSAVRINGHFVAVCPARAASLSLGHGVRPSASFRIGQKTLSNNKKMSAKKVGGVILYMEVPGYPWRMFTYTSEEILNGLFSRTTNPTMCIAIPVTKPRPIKTPNRKFDHWRDHEGKNGLLRLHVPG